MASMQTSQSGVITRSQIGWQISDVKNPAWFTYGVSKFYKHKNVYL